ncbi:MAG: glycosyltransferase family 39 protein [Acidobacteriia bacterium]|nr:glycosyltransferase family 39 protein [Terriglobia bacterium]
MVREHRKFFLAAALAGLILRVLFLAYFPAVTDDSRIYADFATNWARHSIYGQTESGKVVPTDTRLPGYPAFLAAIFALFGSGNLKAVMLVQILVDLGTCFIVADLARRTLSDRAARIAFVLAALCPFLANYAAAALTETLEVFFTTLVFDCAVAALDRMNLEQPCARLWAATGAAVGACILLRPDGGILLAVLGLYLIFQAWRRRDRSIVPVAMAATLVAGLAVAPLVPWTIRNFRTLHHFQPLAPRYANEIDQPALRGFNRWVKTWIVDYASVEEIYWAIPGDKLDAAKLPNRAFDSPQQQGRTLALIADYNQSQEMTPELDARFGELAIERIGSHPLRYYLVLPALRIADMWLRPRTEILPPDVRWWEFNDDPKASVMAVGFGLLNLIYVGTALLALVRRPTGIRYAGLFVIFLLLRSAFLGTLENPEPRYTLECYPVVILLGTVFLNQNSRWMANP